MAFDTFAASLMTREQVRVGVAIRVMRDRWDVTAGTLARVDTGEFGEWCFTVRWHLPPPERVSERRIAQFRNFRTVQVRQRFPRPNGRRIGGDPRCRCKASTSILVAFSLSRNGL